MRAKLLGGVAALALIGCAVLASVGPASAQYRPGWGWDPGWGYGPGAVAAGVIGGTIAAVTSPLWAPGYYDYAPGYYDYAPGYAYGPAYATPGYYDYAPGYTYAPAPSTVVVQGGPDSGSVASCETRFRSYNPSTGMYMGYDGQEHPCP